ncbi:MAG: hypothetical protein KGQ66_22060 [Acidobacteriota bacterium]|nr:hypothetical protein [Acidobacteriota bacterium]
MALLVALAILVGALVWWLWPSSPGSAFRKVGFGLTGQAVVGQVTYVSPAISSLRPITVTAISPILARDSAPGVTFILVCAPQSSEGMSDRLTLCGHPDVFHPVQVNPGDGGSVALGVVPLTSGVVKITGFKVQYRDGTQGTIHTATAGTNISLRATPPSS